MLERLSTLAIVSLCGLSASAVEYIGEAPSGQNSPATPTDNLTRIPRDAYDTPPSVGVPYRSLFRDTRAPYLNTLRDVRVTPTLAPAETVRADAQVDLPDFRGRFPLLQRGFAPENADLKVGPLYFKLRHISAAVLFSDNINRSGDNRESGSLSIFSIGGQIMAQLTEGFHIAIAGNFVYFPSEGRTGFSGFSLHSPYSFGISGAPAAQTQVSWEPTFFGLPFVIADEFKLGLYRFSNTLGDDFDLLEGSDFDATTQEGSYSLSARGSRSNSNGGNTDDRDRSEHLYYSNEASISTNAPLPGQNLLHFRASHENLWYLDDNSEKSRLPSVRDRATVGIESVRENLRFKPYAKYDFYRSDNPEHTDHAFRTGIKGPITDLLRFRGEVGYYLRNDGGSVVWRLGLYHLPNPYTSHALEYTRDISDFHDEISQGVRYHITKTLGPDLSGTAYVNYHEVEDLFDSSSNRKELRTGLRLSYLVSPRTRLNLRGQYSEQDYDDNNSGSTTVWLTRFDLEHRFLDRLVARFIYQYERRNSESSVNTYDENLAYLSLSWLFE